MVARVLERLLPDESASERLGEDIAAVLEAGDVVALRGELGAGKTTLARAVIRALANDAVLEVPSPTFTLVQAYDGRLTVHHFDLYRLGSADELEELGLEEAVAAGAVLVEWPERGSGRLGPATTVELREAEIGRRAIITGPDAALDRIARSLAIRDFLESAGRGSARRSFLQGDASVRAYETVTTEKGERLILMNAPRRDDEPPVRDGRPYSRIAHLAQSVSAFVAIATALRSSGFPAPAVHAADLDRGLVLTEHLGGGSFLDAEGRPVRERYCAAARLLADIHAVDWPRAFAAAPGLEHRLPPYDAEAMAIETELCLDWYLPYATGRPASAGERQAFAVCWERLFERLRAAEQGLVLRDVHSPNLIWRGDRREHERIGILDFQDALWGPTAYDVASLALDARVTMTPELEAATVAAYCEARAAAGGFDRAFFEEAYAITAAQRNTKLLGIFVRLDRRDGKPGYLGHLPRIHAYLRRVLAHPALRELCRLYSDIGALADEGE